ncbi:class I SAM-dependent methyltransferase [Pajaroellobacter abortibovis]|uniref:Methyltransferase type 11 domain-containing protein n=1 Tax=Pajaroellobacter abortibovis TaxID=1882918 RepID=A0A1L6MZ13_9BACT|nr:class I SAM-dependent methyltransferase [Pajaroellobacter abortibovis]APS00762.1 hypothetical protein BCY86_08775 [Pajaroellobacter abortibovis]
MNSQKKNQNLIHLQPDEFKVVHGFGEEWTRFDQSDQELENELQTIFNHYFSIFPWDDIPPNAVGFDFGCGSGRWAKLAAPRVRKLHCIDASEACLVASQAALKEYPNCQFHLGSIHNLPLEDESMDFGYSLGVLHHLAEPIKGLETCVRKLKPGAPMLIYLYYALENRPMWFRKLWMLTDIGRKLISSLPPKVRFLCCDLIAATVYFPLSRSAAFLENTGVNVHNIPLAAYRDKSFYTMRTDSLDRFGTRIEKRFTKDQIQAIMEHVGLVDIAFSESLYWSAIGYKVPRPQKEDTQVDSINYEN